jgi:cytochrome c oxidase subunit 4
LDLSVPAALFDRRTLWKWGALMSGQEPHGHVVPVGTYLGIFLALIAMTGITTGVAYIDLGPANTVVALAIAVVKMLLVVLFFMHVKYSPGLTRLVIVAGFFWLAIMVAMTLSDELTRHWTPESGPWSMLLPFLTKFF